MSKNPSSRSLLFFTFFIIAAVIAHSCSAWAYMLDEAKEYRIRADKFQSEGKLDEAITYYEKAVGLDRRYLPVYNSLAICYERKGFLSRAESSYLKALEINYKYAPAHYNLALFYEKYGDIEKAIFHWKQRMRLGHPADVASIRSRAKLAKYAPDVLEEEDAQELDRKIRQQKEQSAVDKITGRNKYITREEKIQDYYLKGMRSYEEGDFRHAQEHFQKMIDVVPVSN